MPQDAGRDRLIRVTVSDDGIGMPPDVRERALEPFFTTKGEHGARPGLAQVNDFVTEMEGNRDRQWDRRRHRGSPLPSPDVGRGTSISIMPGTDWTASRKESGVLMSMHRSLAGGSDPVMRTMWIGALQAGGGRPAHSCPSGFLHRVSRLVLPYRRRVIRLGGFSGTKPSSSRDSPNVWAFGVCRASSVRLGSGFSAKASSWTLRILPIPWLDHKRVRIAPA